MSKPEDLEPLGVLLKWMTEQEGYPTSFNGSTFNRRVPAAAEDGPWLVAIGPISTDTNQHAGGLVKTGGDVRRYKFMMRFEEQAIDPTVANILAARVRNILANVRAVQMNGTVEVEGQEVDISAHVQCITIPDFYLDKYPAKNGDELEVEVHAFIADVTAWIVPEPAP